MRPVEVVQEALDAFVALHKVRDPHSGCLTVPGKSLGGFNNAHPYLNYAVLGVHRSIALRRVAYAHYFGEVPHRLRVTTTCGNPACFAKAHLKLASVSELIAKALFPERH